MASPTSSALETLFRGVPRFIKGLGTFVGVKTERRLGDTDKRNLARSY